MTPPLVVDVDGTLTGPDRAVDPRVCPVLRGWDAPVVVATGKALPYPVALCDFVGLPQRVVAENGGAVLVDDELRFLGDREAAEAAIREYEARGYDLGWGASDTVNRWRETEMAVSLDAPEAPLREVAAEFGLEVVDTGFAYHVKSSDMSKGEALAVAAELLGYEPSDFVAVGDSENDASTFEVVGRSFAVANADETAEAAADEVTDGSYADGFLEAVETVCGSDRMSEFIGSYEDVDLEDGVEEVKDRFDRESRGD